MIVDKSTLNNTSQKTEDPVTATSTTEETVSNIALIEVYKAVKAVLLTLHENANDDATPPYFKTVKLDTGQFDRIVRGSKNLEEAVLFPAVFIRFTNVRYLTGQQRTSKGRATCRIRYILNNLDLGNDDIEIEPMIMFDRINTALQDAKSSYSALNERFLLAFHDMPESLDNGLQPYWIDYTVWFRETNSLQSRNWITRYLVMPPYTNHSDAPVHDTSGHGDHVVDYDDVSKITDIGE